MNLLALLALCTLLGYYHGADVALLVFILALPVIGLAELLFNR